ncbi:3-phosphoshikimate 1-carboxyvinyltransferase [Patescibacteria group bacterium]
MPTSINPPASKSISNRLLILAAIIGNNIKIQNLAKCDDTFYMLEALKKLGVKIEQKNNTTTIKTSILSLKQSDEKKEIYTDNAGTTTRFFTALSTISNQNIIIDGSKRMRERPLKDLIQALTKLGANIEHQNFHVPLKIHPTNLKGTTINLPGNISSQFLSALILIAPFVPGETIIKITTELCSIPYVKITLNALEQFGLKVIQQNWRKFTIPEQKIDTKSKITTKTVENDASSASYIGAFAALNPGTKILIKNVFTNSIQGDIKFLDYLKKMGCKTQSNKEGIIISGPNKLKPLGIIDMNSTPDLVMTFAVLAMFTPGKTTITNIANLRVKETDRLAALENEIKKFNIKVKSEKDYIEIQGNPELIKDKALPSPNLIKTYDDHRIAMCFGILKSHFPDIEIENPNCVSKSYPNFWTDLNKMIKANNE